MEYRVVGDVGAAQVEQPGDLVEGGDQQGRVGEYCAQGLQLVAAIDASYLPLIEAAGPFDGAMAKLRATDAGTALASRIDGLAAVAASLGPARPLLIIQEKGAVPVSALELGVADPAQLMSISLGQGQDKKAIAAIRRARAAGGG